jgi:hypothetical protein
MSGKKNRMKSSLFSLWFIASIFGGRIPSFADVSQGASSCFPKNRSLIKANSFLNLRRWKNNLRKHRSRQERSRYKMTKSHWKWNTESWLK